MKIENLSKKPISKKLIEYVKNYAEEVKNNSGTPLEESDAEKQKRIKDTLKCPKKFVEYYIPNLPTTSKIVLEAVKDGLKPNAYIWYKWFRGLGKSTYACMIIPLILKARKEKSFFVIVGKTQEHAIRLIANLQMQLENNQRYIADFGEQKVTGSWTDNEFRTADGCIFVALGMGQSPRGLNINMKRPDYIVCSDLDNKMLSKNPARCREMYNWIKEDLLGTEELGSKNGFSFVFDNNYFSKTSIGHLFETEDEEIRVSRIDIMDKDGNPTVDRISKEEIEKKRKKIGYRAFMREYMNTPIEEGSVFKADWIRYKPMELNPKSYEWLCTYSDYAFKGGKNNDFTAIVLVGKKGKEYHIIKAFCRQCTLSVAIKWHYDLAQDLKKQNIPCVHVVESGFTMDMILDKAYEEEGEKRKWHMDIKGDTTKKTNKQERIEAISVKWENGNVYYNELERSSIDMQTGIEQTLSFERGTKIHDDFPDATEGAITYLGNKGAPLLLADGKRNYSLGKIKKRARH